MGYIMGLCPHCNNIMSMPDDSAVVRCPTCHQEVVAAEAAALAGAANGQGAPQQPPVPGQANGQGIPQQPPAPGQAQDPYRAADAAANAAAGATVGAAGASAPTYANPNPAGLAIGGAADEPAGAVMRSWKTNVLFTVLGIFAACALSSYLGGMEVDDESFTAQSMASIFGLIYCVFVFVYALKIYPSLFTKEPMIESNEGISFLNGFVGGIIFGLLWNRCLTLRRIGISHIVFVVLIVVGAVMTVLGVILAIGLIGASI